MENKVTFHINNMAYTIVVDPRIEKEITRYLDINRNLDTTELLAAYIRVAQEHALLKEDLEEISNKIPRL